MTDLSRWPLRRVGNVACNAIDKINVNPSIKARLLHGEHDQIGRTSAGDAEDNSSSRPS